MSLQDVSERVLSYVAEFRTIIVFVCGGLSVWLINAVMDFFFFYEGSFLDILITDIPLQEFYDRVLVLAIFVTAGVFFQSEKEEREQALRHFKTLFNLTVDPIVIVDTEGILLEVTDRVEEVIGYKKNEIVGKNLDELPFLTPESKETLFSNLRKRVEGMDLPPYTVKSVTKSGDRKFFDVNAEKIEYRGDVAVMASFRDITERKLYEDRLEALHRHESLLSSADNMEEVAELTLDTLESVFGYHGTDFVEAEDGLLKLVESRGREIPPMRTEASIDVKGLIPEAARTGNSILVSDVRGSEEYFEAREETLSELVVPVKIGDEVVAVINVESQKLGTFNVQDKKLVEILAEHVSSAITRLRQVEEIQVYESRYRQLLEELPDPVFVSDDENYIFCNKEAVDLLGYDSPTEIIRHPFVEFFPKRLRPLVTGRAHERLSGGKPPKKYDLAMLTKDGGEVDLEVNLRTITFQGKEAILSVMRDISERKLYEERLETLHKYNSKLGRVDTLREVMNVTMETLEEGLGFQWMALAFVEDDFLHFRRRNLDISIPDLPLDGGGLTVRAVNTGETQLVPDTRKDPDYLAFGTVNGSPFLSELDVPIKIGDHVIGVINIESTELDAFSEEDRKLTEILANNISSTISRLEYEDRLESLHMHTTMLNEAKSMEEIAGITLDVLHNVFGFKRQSFNIVEGETLKILKAEPSTKLYELPLKGKGITVRAVNTGETQLADDVRQDPDYLPGLSEGEMQTVSELAVPVKIDDKVVAVINVESKRLGAFTEQERYLVEILASHVSSAIERLRRIESLEELVSERTEELREAYEELQELDRMKDQFIGMATHELRTPLVSIKGYVDYIQSGSVGEVPGKIGELLEIVQRNTDRLSRITDDLLDQQRLESGEMDIEKESIQLSDVIQEVVEEVEPMLEEKSQELEVHTHDELPMVEADRTRISQVLVNLLSNASKFSPEESKITLNVEEIDKCVKISIEDEGIGLGEEDMEELFEPFPQIERPTVTEKSTGLGLSICRGIVELHGGEIWAESEGRGEGTTFTFILPKN